MSWLRDLYEKIKVNGKIRNHSSKILLVIETDSEKPTAHKLYPNRKSPPDIDSDGVKRFDGKPINGHSHWWKISDYTTADVYDRGTGLKIDVITKMAVSDGHFGEYEIDRSNDWGEPMIKVTNVRRHRPGGAISEYHVEQYGWVSKQEAVELAAKGVIDNASPVFPKRGSPYLRSRPDQTPENNLGGMEV